MPSTAEPQFSNLDEGTIVRLVLPPRVQSIMNRYWTTVLGYPQDYVDLMVNDKIPLRYKENVPDSWECVTIDEFEKEL